MRLAKKHTGFGFWIATVRSILEDANFNVVEAACGSSDPDAMATLSAMREDARSLLSVQPVTPKFQFVKSVRNPTIFLASMAPASAPSREAIALGRYFFFIVRDFVLYKVSASHRSLAVPGSVFGHTDFKREVPISAQETWKPFVVVIGDRVLVGSHSMLDALLEFDGATMEYKAAVGVQLPTISFDTSSSNVPKDEDEDGESAAAGEIPAAAGDEPSASASASGPNDNNGLPNEPETSVSPPPRLLSVFSEGRYICYALQHQPNGKPSSANEQSCSTVAVLYFAAGLSATQFVRRVNISVQGVSWSDDLYVFSMGSELLSVLSRGAAAARHWVFAIPPAESAESEKQSISDLTVLSTVSDQRRQESFNISDYPVTYCPFKMEIAVLLPTPPTLGGGFLSLYMIKEQNMHAELPAWPLDAPYAEVFGAPIDRTPAEDVLPLEYDVRLRQLNYKSMAAEPLSSPWELIITVVASLHRLAVQFMGRIAQSGFVDSKLDEATVDASEKFVVDHSSETYRYLAECIDLLVGRVCASTTASVDDRLGFTLVHLLKLVSLCIEHLVYVRRAAPPSINLVFAALVRAGTASLSSPFLEKVVRQEVFSTLAYSMATFVPVEEEQRVVYVHLFGLILDPSLRFERSEVSDNVKLLLGAVSVEQATLFLNIWVHWRAKDGDIFTLPLDLMQRVLNHVTLAESRVIADAVCRGRGNPESSIIMNPLTHIVSRYLRATVQRAATEIDEVHASPSSNRVASQGPHVATVIVVCAELLRAISRILGSVFEAVPEDNIERAVDYLNRSFVGYNIFSVVSAVRLLAEKISLSNDLLVAVRSFLFHICCSVTNSFLIDAPAVRFCRSLVWVEFHVLQSGRAAPIMARDFQRGPPGAARRVGPSLPHAR